MGWYNKKMTDQYAVEKRRVSSFYLKEESEDKCHTESPEESSRTQAQSIEWISSTGPPSEEHRKIQVSEVEWREWEGEYL